ncbi:unnamed protein product [Dicrocoelium dendriticum]|nr:unnamed protein product [Dicrocoelium dendriticum]
MQMCVTSGRPDGAKSYSRHSAIFCISSLWLSIQIATLTTIRTEATQHIHFTVEEEVPPGFLVGLLYKQLHDDILTGPGNLLFRVIQQGQARLFTVGSKDGRIKVAQRIDREAICPHSEVGTMTTRAAAECELTFPVNLLRLVNSTTDLLDVLRIFILVNDINDHPCHFVPSDEQILYLPEDAQIFSSMSLYQPSDLDTGPGNGIARSSIMMTLLNPTTPAKGSSWFDLKITEQESLTKPFSLSLVLITPLDYEMYTRYVLRIEAQGGMNMTCSLMVTVLVTDANDNSPKFSRKNYTVHISENTDITFPIFTVSATDNDAGPYFSQMQYDFDTATPTMVRSNFRINKKNGSIFLKGPISHQHQSSYNIPLVVRNFKRSQTQHMVDLPDNQFADRAQLTVNLTRMNHRPPTISVYTPEGRSVISIPEHTVDIPFDFAVVTVTTDDAQFSESIDCMLNQPGVEQFALTQIGASSSDAQLLSGGDSDFEMIYKLSALAAFDRETTSTLHITISCWSKNVNFEHLVEVKIADKNDHPPEFDKTNWRFMVSEDSDPERYKREYIIGQVVATDADDGVNAQITYKIGDESSNMHFTVNNLTGVISSKGVLDREAKDYHQFTIVAIDGGDPPLTANTVVEVIVQDYNDEIPIFGKTYYIFHIVENNMHGEFVGSLTATDMDKGGNSALKFQMEYFRSGVHSIGTSVNNSSRVTNLPFELVQRFDILHNFYEVRIYARAIIDREEVSHTYVGMPMSEYFINGALPTQQLDEQVMVGFKFWIIATDDGIPHQSSQAIVHVIIDDLNDRAPTFQWPTNNSTLIKVSYLEKVGYVICQVRAVDPDEGSNGTVRYKLERITLINQSLTVNQQFDRSDFISANKLTTDSQTRRTDDGGSFAIQDTSGTIYLASRLKLADVGKLFAIDLIAHDLGTPTTQRTSATFFVHIDTSAPIGDMNNDYQVIMHEQTPRYPSNNNESQLNFYIIVAIIFVAFFISAILIAAVGIALRRIKKSGPQLQAAAKTYPTVDSQEKHSPYFDQKSTQCCREAQIKPTKTLDNQTRCGLDSFTPIPTTTQCTIGSFETPQKPSETSSSITETVRPNLLKTSCYKSDHGAHLKLENMVNKTTVQLVNTSCQNKPIFLYPSESFPMENLADATEAGLSKQSWLPLKLPAGYSQPVALLDYNHATEMQHLCAHSKHTMKRNCFGSVDKDSGNGDSLETMVVPVLSVQKSIWLPSPASLSLESDGNENTVFNHQGYTNALQHPAFTVPLVHVCTPLSGVNETDYNGTSRTHLE